MRLSSMLCFMGAIYVTAGNRYDFNAFENFELMRAVYKNETICLGTLKRLKVVLEARKKVIDEQLEDMKTSGKADLIHPVDIYGRVKALSFLKIIMLHKWKQTEEAVESAKVTLAENTVDFPTESDLGPAARGLLFLLQTYKVNYEDTSKGILRNLGSKVSSSMDEFRFKAREVLHSSDFGTLASVAFKQNNFDSTVSLLKATFATLKTDPDHRKPTEPFLKTLEGIKRKVVDLNNQHLMKKDTYVGKKFVTTEHLLTKNLGRAKNQKKIAPKTMYIDGSSDEGYDYFLQSSCRGDSLAPVHPKDRITVAKCHWLHHGDPFLRLAPFKLEVASPDPYVVVFHDILSEEEIEFLVEYSKPRLSRKREVDADMDEVQRHEIKSGAKRRIVAKTVQCWVREIHYPSKNNFTLDEIDRVVKSEVDHRLHEYEVVEPLLLRLSEKIGLATRLNLTGKHSASDFQTTNYGLGGMVEPHIDPHGYLEGTELPYERLWMKQSGDLMATFMGWLSDVDAGGATAFMNPGAELAVWPRRGSAAFWFSLDRIGRRDKRTSHAGCPVLQGTKWIFNKWIYMFDQVKNYPCGLEPLGTHQPFDGVY